MDYQAGNIIMGRICRVSIDAEILAKLGRERKKRKMGGKENSGIKGIYLSKKLGILKLSFF